MTCKARKGISPIIATVIIVAITIAIAVAVVGWLTGLWSSITGGTGTLRIYSDSFINVSASTPTNPAILMLHLKNTGSGKITVYKLAIGGMPGSLVGFTQVTTGIGTSAGDVYVKSSSPSGGCYVADGKIVIKPDTECYIYITLPWNSGSFAPSGSYTVILYTYEAGTIKAPVQVTTS